MSSAVRRRFFGLRAPPNEEADNARMNSC
jgi:hypothetical protein